MIVQVMPLRWVVAIQRCASQDAIHWLHALHLMRRRKFRNWRWRWQHIATSRHTSTSRWRAAIWSIWCAISTARTWRCGWRLRWSKFSTSRWCARRIWILHLLTLIVDRWAVGRRSVRWVVVHLITNLLLILRRCLAIAIVSLIVIVAPQLNRVGSPRAASIVVICAAVDRNVLLIDELIWCTINDIVWHERFAMSNGNLSLLFARVGRLTNSLVLSFSTTAGACLRIFWLVLFLLLSIVHLLLRLLEDVLSPQVKEVVGICVEFEAIFAIVTIAVELVEWRRLIAHQIRLLHGCWHCCTRENVLIELCCAFEGFLLCDILQRHFLHFAVHLGDFDRQPVYPSLQWVGTVGHSVCLTCKLTEQVLWVTCEGGELSHDVGERKIGDGLKVIGQLGPLVDRASDERRFDDTLRQWHLWRILMFFCCVRFSLHLTVWLCFLLQNLPRLCCLIYRFDMRYDDYKAMMKMTVFTWWTTDSLWIGLQEKRRNT